jgi:hypothetical protein
MSDSSIFIPKKVVDEVRKLGVDVESYIVDLIINSINLDPKTDVEVRLELAVKYLEEGKELIDKDAIQASEKLYKAAEECVKVLASHFNLEDILRRVKERGRWTVSELDDAVRLIASKLGKWFLDSWDHAWTLHVWGFHEGKLSVGAIRDRLPDIERIVLETKKIVETGKS